MCAVVFADNCVNEEQDGDWMEITRKRFDHAVRAEAERTAARLFPTTGRPCP
jgi:hypothetical protein